MKNANPFIISGYFDPLSFCDRETETERMLEAIRNERNMTLISWRRMGKTGLISHVFHNLRNNKKLACFYVDLLPTSNLSEFIKQFSNAVLGKLDSVPSKLINKLGSALSNLRPTINFDGITGEPGVSFEMRDAGQEKTTLEQIFNYLKTHDQKIVIALDEFQQITSYPDKNTEALLRSFVQQNNNVIFIFSGSKKHVLQSMFSDSGRPFYNSTELIFLDSIVPNRYKDFIRLKFAEAGKSINDEAIDFILEWTRTHTWYVQYVCNRLFSLSDKNYDVNIIKEMILKILHENETVYFNYRNLLTSYQWQLLVAVAKEKTLSKPNAKEFILKHNLGTASSVSSALNALQEKELIYYENDIYQVYDVFLSRWLERL